MSKKVITLPNEVDDWFYGSERPDILSFDWETTGLDYLKMEPVGISFYDGKDCIYIDLWENTHQKDILNILKLVFKSGLFIAHNAKFDIKCCKKFLGFYPENIFCTFIASFLLNENLGSHSLKNLAKWKLKVPESKVKKWETAAESGYHSNIFYRYCFNDSIWTYELYKLFKPQIASQELKHVFYDIEMPFIPVAADMEINGVLVDQEYLRNLEFRVKNKLIELEDRMFDRINRPVILQSLLFSAEYERILPINLRSTDQLVKVIEKDCGLTVTEKSEKGKKSVTSATLKRLKGRHQFIDLLADYKAFRKLYDSYLKPVWDWIGDDGRLRPTYGIVKTGRTSNRSPNLQQLPNLRKYPTFSYRRALITEEFLVGGDYSGQELRVLAEETQDETLLHAFRNNYDLHLLTANANFGLNLSDKSFINGTPEHTEASKKYWSERYKAKNGANFPIVYGTSKYGISYNMGVSKDEAQSWIDGFFTLYPGVKAAINEANRELKDVGEVRTLMGRKRRFPDYDILPFYAKGKNPSQSRCQRQAFNFKIQGFSADQVKIAARKCWERGLKLLMIIHDEIVIETPRPEQDAKTLKQCMENAVSLSIPFEVDVKIGKNYGEIK